MLQQIFRVAVEECVDALVIAGDIYDRSVPSTEAVSLLDEFLTDLSEKKIPVIMISGNHDSPERVGFADKILEKQGIYIAGAYDGSLRRVEFKDEYGKVVFVCLPFVKPAVAGGTNCAEAVRNILKEEDIALGDNERYVLVTHYFVTGESGEQPELSESETGIDVGGIDNVPADIFAGFDYVALGHLHGPQNIGGNRMRYCGTPLKYSFSETGHDKSVTVVSLGAKGDLLLNTLPLAPLRDMRKISGTFAQLTDKAFYSVQQTEDYLHVVLTDEEDVPEAMGRLRVIYPNIMKLSYDNTRTRENQTIDGAEDVQRRQPLELFEELFALQNNQEMSETQRCFVQELIEEIWEGRI